MGKWSVPYHGATEDFLRALVGTSETDCIIWPYGKNPSGHGLAVINGKQRGAHNWMCRLAYGDPVSIWKHAAHRCGNPACVNPNHLRWATHRENMLDKRVHGTENVGSRNGKTTLTEADVLEIRAAPAKLAPLAEKFGISKHAISRIRAGKRWGHVGGPITSRERGTQPTCWNGHAFDEANTRWTKDGYRQCRACDAAKARSRRSLV